MFSAPPMFRLTEEINLYERLPILGFKIQESTNIIHGINKSKATLQELVEYIAGQRRQQRYNDYTGVAITPEHIAALKAMVRPKDLYNVHYLRLGIQPKPMKDSLPNLNGFPTDNSPSTQLKYDIVASKFITDSVYNLRVLEY